MIAIEAGFIITPCDLFGGASQRMSKKDLKSTKRKSRKPNNVCSKSRLARAGSWKAPAKNSGTGTKDGDEGGAGP
jgi:hypothetical protein